MSAAIAPPVYDGVASADVFRAMGAAAGADATLSSELRAVLRDVRAPRPPRAWIGWRRA